MNLDNNRAVTLQSLQQDWDVIIVGGGITGAGVFRLAVAQGLRVLLLEQNDFSSGTSSRSSKLIHGGIRYLRNRQYDITRESVREREALLREAPSLVSELGFVLPYSTARGQREMFRLGTILYDLLAPKWKHRGLSLQEVHRLIPQLSAPWLAGAYLYYDAVMDDARMVLRLIQETCQEGGTALNYARVEKLLTLRDGTVCGVALSDQSPTALGSQELRARVVINAAGPWCDGLRRQVNAPGRLRPQRGSHLIFPKEKLSLPHAVTLLHPKDGRAMFAIPWEGATIIGTTDLDHPSSLDNGEPYCTQAEIDYILEAADAIFPSVKLNQADALSSFAGLRPIIRGSAADPSAESRAHVVWEENGLITITGGKFTIFRKMAADALQAAAPRLGVQLNPLKRYYRALPKQTKPEYSALNPAELFYLAGRYGPALDTFLSTARPAELSPVGDLPTIRAELRYAARSESVQHLDDLLLRRTRLGLLLPEGARAELPTVREIAQEELGWEDARWEQEAARYAEIYKRFYSSAPAGI
ncbi:MAG: glycerol-3-phosphate dehydrogenase/oxidase [Chloroflexi bacterium]|jgi:glycerol-3-phosphate dehydrogenase|nr:glycerol-3-phosphate dehydrogenase/oxidase [Anaerolineaceae bacterium]NLI44597.1 glycerol-3-phosphate dehydrogenase/oxidase [Chloroflexota bacterium]HOE35052.1 glycerol-3-phosphate dehydrogenase/oxidase [Anaerolineaceae bacterium]HOT26402.1 glycerol-3-phosphate dehydrogenase/oxidase [Anaerolineaceae bacterium]HQH58517.1 glycerol-3-phosphate dehydrogenase/oxidase [Anaerolineaceae bacterium]